MKKTLKPLLTRALSLLTAVCMAVGFIPLADYSVFAADPVTTIGELASGSPRSGSGWSWDGINTLTLFGAELKSKDDSTPKITFTDNIPEHDRIIKIMGYNRAVGDSLLVDTSSAPLDDIIFEGTGILECDSTQALFNNENVSIEDGFIKAPDATLFDSADYTTLRFYNGYLDIGTINAEEVWMFAGVINCKTLRFDNSFGSFRQTGGVFYTDKVSEIGTSASGTSIVCSQNAVFRAKETAGFHISQLENSIVMLGDNNARVSSDHTAEVVDGMNVYCNKVSPDITIYAGDDTSGVYYKSGVSISQGAELKGAVYFADYAWSKVTGCDYSIADGATVVCGSIRNNGNNGVTIGEQATVYALGSAMTYFEGITIKGGIYGSDSASVYLTNCTLAESGRVYSRYGCEIDYGSMDGGVTVYGSRQECAVTLGDVTINGSLTSYDSRKSGAAEIVGSPVFGGGSTIYFYTEYNKIISGIVCTDLFDHAAKDRTFYSAEELGGEYKAMVSIDHYNCGKSIYVGNSIGGRLDSAYKNSLGVYNGSNYSVFSTEFSADPNGSQKALLLYDCTEDIDLDSVDVQISNGGSPCTDKFNIAKSHYYTDGIDSDPIKKSLGIEISAKEELSAEETYDVAIEYNGMKAQAELEAKGVEFALDFTKPAGSWSYGGSEFLGTDQDCSGTTWAWYANADTQQGYPAKTLVLNGIDFASIKPFAINVPDGATVILKGDNRLAGTSSAIASEGSLTIIGEDGGSLYAISSQLGMNSYDYKSYNAVIIAKGDVTIKNATLTLWGKKGAEVPGDGASNKGYASCFGISADPGYNSSDPGDIIIENSDITVTTGSVDGSGYGGNIHSACLAPKANTILRGANTLSLTSQEYAVYSTGSGGIISVDLSRLSGAAVTIDEFNRGLSGSQDRLYAYALEPDAAGGTVLITTKGIVQNKAVEAGALEPGSPVTLPLYTYFEGGSGSYKFAAADGETLPDWFEFTDNDTQIRLNVPDERYYGGTYNLCVVDAVEKLRTDPLVFELTVGKIAKTYNIDVVFDSTLGTVTPESAAVADGGDETFIIEAKPGAYISAVTVDGNAAELSDTAKTSTGRITGGKYTFTQVSEAHELAVEFKEIPDHQVTVNSAGNGTVTVETAAISGKPDHTFSEGADVVISVKPGTDCRVKSVKLDGADITLTDGKYTIEKISAAHEFSVEFEEIPSYRLTVSKTGNGFVAVETPGINGKPEYSFWENTDVIVSVTPDSGNRIKSVKLDGADITLADGKYTIEKISAAHEFSVEFEEIPSYRLTVSKTGNGSVAVETPGINGKPEYTFWENTEITVSVVPAMGYVVKSVKLGDSKLTPINGKYTFAMTGDCTLAVEFTRRTSGGTGGSGSSGRPAGGGNDDSAQKLLPSLNGIRMSWDRIASELDKMQPGSSAVISLNGITTVPEPVIKSMIGKKLQIEFVNDSIKSWLVDGAKIPSAVSADFIMLPGNADRSGLRGTFGVDIRIMGTGIPADLKLNFRREFGGQFVNSYILVNNELEFLGCSAVGTDGSAIISGVHSGGEYIAMVSKLSDVPGDMNNDGVLNALDSAAILMHTTGIETGANPLMGDFNNDGTINALDASAILKKAAGEA